MEGLPRLFDSCWVILTKCQGIRNWPCPACGFRLISLPSRLLERATRRKQRREDMVGGPLRLAALSTSPVNGGGNLSEKLETMRRRARKRLRELKAQTGGVARAGDATGLRFEL